VSGFLWSAFGVFASIGLAALGDMVSEEVRDRLDHLPHAILRLAALRLDPVKRVLLYERVWLPDLAYFLKGDEARPVTRLLHGARYAIGILATARGSARSIRVVPVPSAPELLVLEQDVELVESLHKLTVSKLAESVGHASAAVAQLELVERALEDHQAGDQDNERRARERHQHYLDRCRELHREMRALRDVTAALHESL
jgi:hypothetical protein